MVELYDHQKKAAAELGNGKILVGGVGTGKSITALEYYVRTESPRPIFVITTARKRDEGDWEREAALFSISTKADLSAHGPIKVDSWNNIQKYTETEGAFFLFDEQRLVGSGAWVKAFYKIAKRNRWILLSATPGDTWSDYIPVFVANGYFKNQTAFKREHVVYSYYGRYPKIERYLGTKKLEKMRQAVLVEMPFVRHTTRHLHDVIVNHDQDIFKATMKSRQDPETGEPFEDAGALLRALRKISNSDESRTDAVGYILKDHPRLIVFYNFDYELEMLREHFKKEDRNDHRLEVAEWNGHKHEPLPEGDHWVYLVQYAAGAEAWNCTSTDAMVFFSLTYSYKNFEQAQGRIDRLNTKYEDLHYYILKSKTPVDRMVWQALKNKKNFNEKGFMKQFEKREKVSKYV